MAINPVLANNIKHYRNLYDMTQSELAEEIGVEAIHITNVEKGRKGISLDRMVLICECFHVGLSDLLPIENQDDAELRHQWRKDIVSALDRLDMNQLGVVRKMVCSLLSD